MKLPRVRCPKCDGKGCDLCYNTGTITELLWHLYRNMAQQGLHPWVDYPPETWRQPERVKE